MKHPTTIEGKDLRELAKEIGRLRYDALRDFLDALADDLQRQYEGDLGRGRKKLASVLYCAAEDVSGAAADIDAAWRICEPYMKESNGSNE